jgi:hypothetical protein
MVRTAYLHLGLPKTGTTTIQWALYRSREAMLTAGFLYPDASVNHSMPLKAMFSADQRVAAMGWMRGGVKGQTREAIAADARAKFGAALATPGWTRLVLSAEGVSTLSAEGLRDVRDWLREHCDEVIVIVCLRQPYDWRLSVIQQHLKSGATIANEIKMFGAPGTLRQTVDRMRQAFGAENLRFLVFEEMLAHKGKLPGAFAEAIGLPPEVIKLSKGRHLNPSMSLRACLVLDRLNQKVPLFVDGKVNPWRSRRVEQMLRKLKGPRFNLPPAQAEQLRAAVEDDMAFAATLLARPVWREAIPTGEEAVARPFGVGLLAGVARVAGRLLP